MPVYRYKSHEDARRAQWRKPGDPQIGPTLRALLSLSSALTDGLAPPRGLFKFRSIEEANAHRDAWERERIRQIRAKVAAQNDAAASTEPTKRQG